MKLAAYVRVSTDAQAREGLGLSVQRKAITSWAKANGHRVVLWAADEGVSGANGVEAREGLYSALVAVQEGQAQGLVAYNLDRLARALHVQEGILGQVWAAGGGVFTVEDGELREDDPDDPYRTAMRQMRGVFSQLERSVIRKRMRDGRRAKAEQGGYAGGAPSLGYRAEGRALVADEEEQAVVARIAALRAQGLSLRAICAALEADGLRSKRGGAWQPTTVNRILRRESKQPRR